MFTFDRFYWWLRYRGCECPSDVGWPRWKAMIRQFAARHSEVPDWSE
jgi:hypothetical protein